LDKNPATIDAYIDSFFSIYGHNYPEHIDQFKRLMYLAQKATSDEIEEAIKVYFSSIVYFDKNFEHLHGFKPLYDLKLIYEFAKKYRNGYDNSDIEKLTKVLLQNGIRFHDIKLLDYLVSYSVIKQNYQNFKEIMLISNPSNEAEYIEQFLRVFKDNIEVNMNNFYLLLSENEMTDLSFEEFKEYMDTKIFSMKLVSDPNERFNINYVDTMNGYEFESFIGSIYEKMGYSVEQTPKSGDQGADLIITKLGERTAVQTKNYKGNASNKAIQEVVASKEFYGCSTCTVVTNSYFTKSALELGKVNNVKLVDREELNSLIDNYGMMKI